MQTTTQTTEPTIAKTILNQINAADFWARARWGVKHAQGMERGLWLECTRGNKILVTLDPSDTYTIEVGKVRSFAFVAKDTMSDVYADTLVQAIDHLFTKCVRP